MSLIWNKKNGGHDIYIKGELVHQIKAADITKALGTAKQKETSVVTAINTKDSLKDNAANVALHITSLSPLRYSLCCGPDKTVLPDKWWDTADIREVALVDRI